MSDDANQPITINKLLDAVYPSFALLAGMQLDLFTVLGSQSLTVDEISRRLEVNPEKLGPLLYALAVTGLLIEEVGTFGNTPEAQQFLVQGTPSYIGGMHELHSNNWKRILDTASMIRNGGPLTEYDYHSGQEELVAILRGLYPGTVKDAYTLMSLFDFSEAKSILDIGGGSGGLAITLVEANPNLRATVLDLPAVIPITRQFIQEAGMAKQISVSSANAVTEKVPGSYEVLLARHLFQVLSADDCRAALRNIAPAVAHGGHLFIIGWVLEDSRISPENTVGYNLILLNSYADGQAYTVSEYKSWLDEAGFEQFNRRVLSNGDSIISVRKPQN